MSITVNTEERKGQYRSPASNDIGGNPQSINSLYFIEQKGQTFQPKPQQKPQLPQLHYLHYVNCIICITLIASAKTKTKTKIWI